jgi:hypothetical protein
MPVSNATSNFKFNHIDGNDQAGYNSINGLITDIDAELYARVCVPGMVTILNTSVTSAATMVSNGWTNLGASPAGLPALTGSYIYIQKAAT